MPRPGTFSIRNARGRTSSITLMNDGMRSRSSALPSRFPTEENGWHGGPPATRSMPWYLRKFDARISVCQRSVCRCAAAYVSQASPSHSTAARVTNPAWASPRDKPPAPEKRSIHSIWPVRACIIHIHIRRVHSMSAQNPLNLNPVNPVNPSTGRCRRTGPVPVRATVIRLRLEQSLVLGPES